MKTDNEILESLVVGGLIGAALGALITHGKNTEIGAIAGAVILASLKASENARKTNIPVLIKEENALYELRADGTKTFIKSLPKNTRQLPKTFTLK